jgi:tetratricopeptide (TPR) repeat protein
MRAPVWYGHYMVRYATLLTAVFLLACNLAAAQEGGDLQAQILYAYHSEDSGRLTRLAQSLTTQVQAGSADPALRYHLAHAGYRLGLLEVGRNAHAAEAAFSSCIDQLKPILAGDSGSVESLVLQSACYSGLAGLKRLEAVLLRTRASERLEAAQKLSPQNPRVVLLAAQEEGARARPGSAESAHAFSRLQIAAQLFERSSATSPEAPGWGHADAYLELGRQLQLRGDIVGARNWIEKSLLASPDYKAAQRQMAELMRH